MPTSMKERALKARLANWKDGRAEIDPAARYLMPQITVVATPDQATLEEVVQFTLTGLREAVKNAGAKLRPDDKRQALLFELGLPETYVVNRGCKAETVDVADLLREDCDWISAERWRQIGADTASVEAFDAVYIPVRHLMLQDPKLRLGDALLQLA